MSWLTDPIEQTALWRSVSWLHALPIVPAVALESARPWSGRPMRIAAMAFCMAAPLAAAHFLELEHSGRLDQLRLSGQTAAAIARRVFAIGAAWIAIGCVALLWALLEKTLTAYDALVVVTMALVATAAGSIATTTTIVRDQIDPRIGTVGLAVAALTTGVTAAALLRAGLPARYFLLALVPLLALIAERARHLRRRLAYPAAPHIHRAADFRPKAFDRLLNWPGFYRGWCLSASGVVLFTIGAPTILLGWWLRTTPYRGDTVPLYIGPLLIGLIAISLICREDVATGRLDVVRQSSRRPAVAAIEMIVGLWFPFVLAAAGLAALTGLLFGVSLTGLQIVAVVALLLAPLPALEGWSSLWPMLTTIPFAIAMVMARGWVGVSQWMVAMIAALGWFGAVRTFEMPGRPLLPAWAAVVAVGWLCLVPFVPYFTLDAPSVTGYVCLMLFLLAQVLVDPRYGRLARCGQPLVIFVVMFAAVTLGSGVGPGLQAAATTVAVWFCAYRIRQFVPDRPAIQASVRFAALMLLAQFDAQRTTPSYSRLDLTDPVTIFAVAASAAVICEIGYRIATWRSTRGTALAIPRP